MNIFLKDIEHVLTPFAAFEPVVAIAVGGSIAAGTGDDDSDVDIYVYSQVEIPLAFRTELANALGRDVLIDNRLWEPGDEWTDLKTGRPMDIIFRRPQWMIDQVRGVLVDFEPRLGYTTTMWDNLLYSTVAYDPTGWYEDLKKTAVVPYPVELQMTVIGHNYRALKGIKANLLHQLQVAVRRGDAVSVNHRITAILACYFDILFAANRVTNPGEKMIIEHVKKRCKATPDDYQVAVNKLISSVSWMSGNIIDEARSLLLGLDRFLGGIGLLPGKDI